ncbi:unnamed protein product, partial [Didymodactylos carnosus]
RSIITDDSDDNQLSYGNNLNHEESVNFVSTLSQYRQRMEHSHYLKLFKLSLKRNSSQVYCEFCQLLVPVARVLIERNQSQHIENVAITFCKEFKLIDESVCIGAVHEYKDAVIQVVGLSKLTSKQLCALAFGCEQQSQIPALNWNVTFPNVPKPPVSPPQPPAPGAPKMRILHISDIHIDFAYRPQSLAECSQPLCCRYGTPAPGHIGAGFWGDYRNCDLPLWTAEEILKYIAEMEEFDIIYHTGDLPSHNVWNQSRADQLYAIETITNLLKKYFPNKVFYSAVGNHETAPCNLYPTPLIETDNITWLYTSLADHWIQLGLPEETRASILRGAFYTTLIHSGLRLISLNMNYCSTENYWLFINSTDPLDQLQWLVNWLQYAEDNNEKVHIIAHHPPRSCLESFSWNFYRIVNRYENTIAGQFYGHAHNDEFIMFYDEVDKTRPVSMAYVTPSLTTASFLNPGY